MSTWKTWTGFDRAKAPTYVALLSAPVLLMLWRCRGMASNFGDLFGRDAGGDAHDLWAMVYQFGAFFLLALVVPFSLLRLVPPRPVGPLGLGRPGGARGVGWTALAVVLVVAPTAYLASRMPEVRAEYPMLRALVHGSQHWRPEWLVPYEAAYVLLYYVAWEAYFRGYLLFTLEKSLGGLEAVLFQTAASVLVHIGKPDGEIVLAIPGGIVLGLIALRTRTIWAPLAIHASLGVLTDVFVAKA